MDKYNQIQSLTRINEIYFKIKINQSNESLDVDYLLDLIQKENWEYFFINLGIFIQSYNLVFLVNNSNDYFVKFEILVPSLRTLLTNKNHQCIFPECNEIILNYKTNFCTEHLESPEINNVQLMTEYFDKHSQELKDIYKNYKEQYNLYNFFSNKLKNNKKSFDINLENKNIKCRCQLELINDTSKLIEIELTNNINELDCLILNDDTYSEYEKPYDFQIDLEDLNKIQLEELEELENEENEENENEEDENEENENEESPDIIQDELDLLKNELNESDLDLSDTELDKSELFDLFKELKLLNNKIQNK
jgi:hypothetical protein